MEDIVDKYMESVNGKPLANLRSEMVAEMAGYREMVASIGAKGCAIGVSPRDNILEHYGRKQIQTLILDIICGHRARGSDRRLQSAIAPPLVLIGEYSNKHRWHYHGVIFIESIERLELLKRKIRERIGRVITEQISSVENYTNYCFKSYTINPQNLLQKWHIWDDSCYVTNVRCAEPKEAPERERSSGGPRRKVGSDRPATDSGAFCSGSTTRKQNTKQNTKPYKRKNILDYI